MPRDNKGDAAFTLMEVMISVVLMLLALGLLLSAFISSKRNDGLAQTHLTAFQIARNEAEQILTKTYTNIVSTSTTLTNKFVTYSINRSVLTNNNYSDITIAVQWITPDSSRPQAFTNYMTICNTN